MHVHDENGCLEQHYESINVIKTHPKHYYNTGMYYHFKIHLNVKDSLYFYISYTSRHSES